MPAPASGRRADYGGVHLAKRRDDWPEVMAEIHERMSMGETLSQICRSAHLPHRQAVLTHVARDEGAGNLYREARRNQADKHYDEIVETAMSLDEIEDTEFEDKKDRAAWVRAKDVKMKALQWAASKLRPDIYAEQKHQKHEVSGTVNVARMLEDLDGSPKVIEGTTEVIDG